MFNGLFKDFVKEDEMNQELCEKYSSCIPSEIIQMWQEYGFGSFFEGYLKVINPDDYQELLNDTYFRGSISVPIFVTAFGDIITLEENEYIGVVKYKYGKPRIIAKNFKRFCNNLNDLYFVETYLEMEQYKEAIRMLGKLDFDECFGYVPLLGLGGSEKVDNLKKVKIREHIELISQLVGKIGL